MGGAIEKIFIFAANANLKLILCLKVTRED